MGNVSQNGDGVRQNFRIPPVLVPVAAGTSLPARRLNRAIISRDAPLSRGKGRKGKKPTCPARRVSLREEIAIAAVHLSERDASFAARAIDRPWPVRLVNTRRERGIN